MKCLLFLGFACTVSSIVLTIYLVKMWYVFDICELIASSILLEKYFYYDHFKIHINYVLIIVQNYSSIITVHPEIIDGRAGTMVIESFVVDVPDGNTKDETCYFVEALIKCNLKSLADVSEHLAVQGRTEPIDRM